MRNSIFDTRHNQRSLSRPYFRQWAICSFCYAFEPTVDLAVIFFLKCHGPVVEVTVANRLMIIGRQLCEDAQRGVQVSVQAKRCTAEAGGNDYIKVSISTGR